ncbi:MAG: phosphonate ABC transporter ATP-binding protein [Arenicella sp.]
MNAMVEVSGISKTFGETQALKCVDFHVNQGEMVGLIGSSGSGKSTLLRLIAGLVESDGVQDACIKVDKRNIQTCGRLAGNVRKNRSCIAFIFQQFNLVRRLSVETNVLLGLLGDIPRWRGTLGWFTKQEKLRALQALERVGLAGVAEQRASTLSGGQQQRVAIARALLQDASVIVADEPIASLDPRSAKKVMDILADINHQDGKTVIVSLHQVDYAQKYCQRIVGLTHGVVKLDVSADQIESTDLSELYGTANDEIDFSSVVTTGQQHAEPMMVPVAAGV